MRGVVGQQIDDVFAVWDWGGRVKKSGLAAADMDVKFFHGGSLQTVSFSVAEVGTSGDYVLTWTPDKKGWWQVRVYVGYNMTEYVSEVDVVETADEDVVALIQRALGLSHENLLIDNTQYDAESQLVSARVRLFKTAADAQAATPGGTTPPDPQPLAEYNVETVWDAVNKYRYFRQVMA